MKTILFQKSYILNILFIFLFFIGVTACTQKNKFPKNLKIDTEEFDLNQNTTALFLINISNLSQNIIAASEMAMNKSTNQDIIQLSIEVKKEQELLLEGVNKLADNNLIIIAELNNHGVKKNKNVIITSQEKNFDEQYIDYLFFALDEEIKFFEDFILKTPDIAVEKFVVDAIPKQQNFIGKMQNFKNEFLYEKL